MYYFGSEFISGVNVGFEHMSYKQIGRKGKGWILLLDLAILRVMIEWDEEGTLRTAYSEVRFSVAC